MATNDFKPFATAANANVTAQADWEALPALLSGFTAGKASSEQVNKALRQASFIAAALAQYTANKSGQDVLDNGDLNGFISKMGAAFGKDFQALDATLTALAGLTTGANKLPYFTGNDTAALADLTSVGRNIISKNDIADVLTYLGLGAGAPPIGIPFYWPLAAMPNTVMPEWSDMVFLKPNGASFSAATYPKLALVWPGLVIPEMRGEFIRIFDDGRGVNPVQPLLAWADSRLITHTHVLPTGRMAVGVDDVSSTWVAVENDVATPKISTKQQSGGAGETAPRSIAFNCLVRAK